MLEWLFGLIVAIVISIIAVVYRYTIQHVVTGGYTEKCEHTLSGIPTAELAEREISVPFSRVLADDARELEYQSDRERLRLQLHIGQRKLLLNEIEFLTLHGHLADSVLYVGAAPGTHIRMLSKMFPEHHFTLYDPRDFNIKSGRRITVHQNWFTDADAAEWTGRPHLFISDIRNAEKFSRDGDDEHDGEVMEDMDMQRRWVETAKPMMAMLKFRLSWKVPQQEYFDGEIRLQPWAPKTSTETRLITDGKTMRMWDTKRYERQMYRHNMVTRIAYYDVDQLIPGMDHCYDCKSEVYIFTEWAKKAGQPCDSVAIARLMRAATKISKPLAQSPHGLFPQERDINRRERLICGKK